jgi:hypothetical protein
MRGNFYGRHYSLENVSDAVPQCRRDGIARHFDRLRARCRLARDAITKRISFARMRRHRLPRIAEQVFDGLPIRRRQVRKR